MVDCREELEPRLLRERPRPSSRDTTGSKLAPKIDRCIRLTSDFHTNKRIIDDIAIIQSKRLRNMIAGKEFTSNSYSLGFTTHMMKRIQKGPVKGISLKLQEEVRFLFYLILYIVGKRKEDGLHSREIRAPDREPRPQGQNRPRDGQGDRPQKAYPRKAQEARMSTPMRLKETSLFPLKIFMHIINLLSFLYSLSMLNWGFGVLGFWGFG